MVISRRLTISRQLAHSSVSLGIVLADLFMSLENQLAQLNMQNPHDTKSMCLKNGFKNFGV